MLRLIDANGEVRPIVSYENYHIKHVEDGCDKLFFDIDISDDVYPYIQEECQIEDESNNWLVKKIDDDRISCELNFDFLKTQIYKDYVSETQTLAQVLERHLPNGWVIQGADVSSIGRTIKFDFCTDFDVIYECMHTYKVRLVWNIKGKIVKVVDIDFIVSNGEYLTSELNLKALSFKGDTTTFATRLYAYGKEGMGIETALLTDSEGNEYEYGLPYVDNNEYAEKVICAYMSDERFTNPTSLYKEALSTVKALSFPVRSYECSVIDLAKQSDDYSFLDFALHDKVTLIDAERKIKVEHRIVEYDEYPEESEENKVTMSCVPSTISSSVQNKIQATEEKIEKTRTDFSYRINMATAMLTAAFGGHIVQEGGELFIMDNPDSSLAQVVWRFNVNGIGKSSTGIGGPYTTAMTVDDTFITNMVQAMIIRGEYIEANSITANKINQSYTDDVLSQSFEAADGLVKSMFSQIAEFLTNDEGSGQLDVLKTTVAELTHTVEGLQLSFSQSYAGGINLVKNSSGLNKTNGWEYTGTVNALQNTDTKGYTVSASCFKINESSLLSQTISSAVVGKTYRITLKAKTTSSYIGKCTVTYNGNAEETVFSISEITDWTEYTAVIRNVTEPTVKLSFTTNGDYLYVADVMMSEGEGFMSWTPAPDEIYTSQVKIDGDGVKVENGRRKTVMNWEEFAGYYDDEQVFKLDDDDTQVKKLTASDSASISDLKIVKKESDSGAIIGVDFVLID